jgi:hypothetical protein
MLRLALALPTTEAAEAEAGGWQMCLGYGKLVVVKMAEGGGWASDWDWELCLAVEGRRRIGGKISRRAKSVG